MQLTRSGQTVPELPERAQKELDEALDTLMARQVCDAALDGAEECPLIRPCAFHERLPLESVGGDA